MAFIPSLSVITSVFNGGAYLPGFFSNLRDQTLFPELELIIVLNEPSASEKQLAKDFQVHYPHQVEILFSKRRETLGASWNRVWRVSRAPYLSMWNVDDLRTIDSLQRQLVLLEENEDWSLCYGDYIAVPTYGTQKGQRRFTPRFNRAQFSRAFAQGGAFWLFRSEIYKTVGYFDEQFRVGADMDLSFRMANKGMMMGKCEGLLGYFTDASIGLSTRDGARVSEIERTAIQLRYGIFDKVNRELLVAAKEYRIGEIQQFGSWTPVESFWPEQPVVLQRRNLLWTVGLLRLWFRRVMKRLGILHYVHNAQDQYLKREI
jgi:hypothetical protein